MDEHITLLHHQLGVASSMATQLAYSQQALISTMCRQLESLQLEDRIQDHFARLHQYQAELEQYYQELQSVYLKVVLFLCFIPNCSARTCTCMYISSYKQQYMGLVLACTCMCTHAHIHVYVTIMCTSNT